MQQNEKHATKWKIMQQNEEKWGNMKKMEACNRSILRNNVFLTNQTWTMEKRKSMKTTSYWIRTMQRGFVWTVWKHEQLSMGMLAQITLFNVGFYTSGMNQWNGSRKQGDTKKNPLGGRRQAAESDMASCPEKQHERWCVTEAHWLIDTWHRKVKSKASHARQITG